MPINRHRRRYLGVGIVVALAAAAAVLVVPPDRWPWSNAARGASARAALERYCLDCHNEAERAGELVLDPADLASVGVRPQIWEKVLRKLASRSMPPPDQPRPDDATYALLQGMLERDLDATAAARPNPGPAPEFRRLTRTEYRNAVRDLLALDNLPAELDLDLLLPADNSSSGFDNLADLLYVSPPILERYIEAATKIARLAVGDLDMPPLINRHLASLQLPQDSHVDGLPLGTRGGFRIDGYFPLDAEYLFTIDFAGRADRAEQVVIVIDGEQIAMIPIEPVAAPRPPPVQLRVRAAAGPARIGVTFIERSEAYDEATLRVRRRSRGELLAIEHVTIAGPYAATGAGDTPSRARLFACRPDNDADDRGCAATVLAGLATRAYRRPVTDTDLVPLLEFYAAGFAERGFERGVQRALERLLISPQFLYRIERMPARMEPGTVFAVTDLELATRLSFFLWSSVPDEELLALARDGRLRGPTVLAQQVERMLADPRATALVTNFAAQWLFARDVAVQNADLYLFRDYDDTLKAALAQELELFVAGVFASGASVVSLLTAEHTFVNERLAEHYAIPGIVGSHFRRVELPAQSPRAGLLGKGGLQVVTSYSNRTSPVLRGKYVLENLLGAPPPAPPADVPGLVTEDRTSGAPLPLRAALERHRADPACAVCHLEMDALGFALENFDATGQWREQDAGAPIDALGVLPDGSRIEGVAGLRRYLAERPEQFVTNFTEKLLMYALGRNVQYYDAPAVRTIVRAAREEGYSLAAIAKGIAASVPFQMRVATGATPP